MANSLTYKFSNNVYADKAFFFLLTVDFVTLFHGKNILVIGSFLAFTMVSYYIKGGKQMELERDLFHEFEEDFQETEQNLISECIMVDKVFDSCFQRKCEPAKAVILPDGGSYTFDSIVFHPGFIVDGSLEITPVRVNFSRVKFSLKVPFSLKIRDTTEDLEHVINDDVDFSVDLEMYMPKGPSEFSFDILLETRSQLLKVDIEEKQAILAVGTFVVVKVVGKVQLQVLSYGYCPPPREYVEPQEEDVRRRFEVQPFPPEFFPPHTEDI